MTAGTAEPYSPAPPEAPAKNSFQRIAGVLFAPAETFRDIARKPDVLVPLLVLVVLGFVAAVVIVPRTDRSDMQDIEERAVRKRQPGASDADVARFMAMNASIKKVTGYSKPALMIAAYAIFAGILLLAFRLFGGEGTYKQAFSVTLYAWIPMVLHSLLIAVVALIRGSVSELTMATAVMTNPAAWLNIDLREQTVIYAALASFDIFTIWSLILFILGFAAVSKFSTKRAAAVVLSLWFVLALIGLGLASIGAAQLKG
jgi:hypothetical protein